MYRTFLHSAAIVLVVNGLAGCAAVSRTQVLGQTAPPGANRPALVPRVGGRTAAVPHFADSFADMPSAGHPAPHARPVVAPGARVRVTAPLMAPEPLVGTVLKLDADTIFLTGVALRRGKVAVPVASVKRLEVSRGRSSLALQFAVIGFIAGAWIGANAVENQSFYSIDEPLATLAGVAVVGGVAGAVVGSAIGSEQWEVVPLDRLRSGMSRGAKRVARPLRRG